MATARRAQAGNIGAPLCYLRHTSVLRLLSSAAGASLASAGSFEGAYLLGPSAHVKHKLREATARQKAQVQ